MSSTDPGRSCPLHYRYRASDFAVPASDHCDVLYVVGGLYGNVQALQRVIELFDAERGDKRLVFNGDFHWFDVDPRAFETIQRGVLAFAATRGNVETELSVADASDAGCGCTYPAWVGDGVVERSNHILARLRDTARAMPGACDALQALSMWRRIDVAGHRVAIVHGDAQSLSGWGFAQESLRDAQARRVAAQWFAQAQVDVFAASHTCLPVFASLGDGLLLNNGAAGMPNFRGARQGLLTRIAARPFVGPQRCFGTTRGALHFDAIAIDYDHAAWTRSFLAQWPLGSDAHVSYASRIADGPDYDPADALRLIPLPTET
jgi:predicted phosphodiesterase